MEYANSGPLKNYLKENFNSLTWNNKYNFAYQLACAVSCLHNEGIIHRDLVIYFINYIKSIIVYFCYILTYNVLTAFR